MYKLKISPEAKNDLAEMKSYISKDLSNHRAAENLVSKIINKISGLSEHPGIGAPLSSVVDINTDYRFLVCARYLIFYRFEDKIVFVSRILHAKQDYTRILFADLSVDE
jgi:toxin ParE1/3/4